MLGLNFLIPNHPTVKHIILTVREFCICHPMSLTSKIMNACYEFPYTESATHPKQRQSNSSPVIRCLWHPNINNMLQISLPPIIKHVAQKQVIVLGIPHLPSDVFEFPKSSTYIPEIAFQKLPTHLNTPILVWELCVCPPMRLKPNITKCFV